MSFRGTAYNGWQLQPGKATVQGVVNRAFSTILGEKINVTGAGRTDTGVHASFFCCHFDSSKNDLDNDQQLIYRLNGFLPGDIAVTSIVKVRPESNARFDATSRTYCYTILKEKDPFLADTGWLLFWSLNIEKMNEASRLLLRYSDFTSFSRLHGGNKTNLCKVSHACWEDEARQIRFTITADRFLRNMVRAITGTMIAVGRDKLSVSDFEKVILGMNRGLAGQSAPAHGLSLTMISYPEDIFI